MAVTKRYWTKGDTLTPLSAELKAMATTGAYAAINLTGLTVKFTMQDADGTDVVAETTVGVTVVNAANGQVYFDFDAAHVATAGTYYAWFKVYSGTNADTYPVNGQTFQIEIV